jgi:NAD(P)-dependent dehydrogenase (short-subunit alcohol dehydrogenase family)
VSEFPRGLAAFSLEGKKALITGGNRGLGFAFTQTLADCGAAVAFLGRSADANEAAVKRLADAGVQAHGIGADLSHDDDVQRSVDEAVDALGVDYASVRIANQRTRWGSCSTTGAMSFNWRLLLAPEDVLDYVVWHEACHLAVLDHSPRFWALVERHLPGYREPRAWLRRHGATLVL